MSTASEVISGTNSQLKQAVAALWDMRVAGRGDFKTNFDAIAARANLGDYGPKITEAGRTGLVEFGRAYERTLDQQLRPVYQNILRLAGRDGDPLQPANWAAIMEYLDANSLTFTARGATYATIGSATKSGKGTAGAIVGDATLHQLLVDRYGYDLDAGEGAATFTLECISDQTLGTKPFEEVFSYRSDKSLTIFHRGPVGEVGAITLRNDGGILKKPSFHIGNAADAAPTGLGPWYDPSGNYSTNYELVTTTYRRGAAELAASPASTNIPLALQFEGNSVLYQQIDEPLVRGVPYLFGVAAYRLSACDRRLKVTLGEYEGITYDMTGHTDGTWALLLATIDENLYPDNFIPVDGATPLRFRFDVEQGSGSNTGKVILDNAFCVPGQLINGRWVWMVPRTLTNALGDKHVFTDGAPSSPGKIAAVTQEWARRHLPTASVPSVADPS